MCRVEVLVPAPHGNRTLWENEFNTDDPTYYTENELIQDPINVYSCDDKTG